MTNTMRDEKAPIVDKRTVFQDIFFSDLQVRLMKLNFYELLSDLKLGPSCHLNMSCPISSTDLNKVDSALTVKVLNSYIPIPWP